jgi:hypothetical protein
VESFIEHQDACTIRGKHQPDLQATTMQPACSSRTASSTSPSSEANFSISAPLQGLPVLPKPPDKPSSTPTLLTNSDIHNKPSTSHHHHNLELQLLSPSSIKPQEEKQSSKEIQNYETTHLKLSIGSNNESEKQRNYTSTLEVARLKEFTNEELKLAMSEKVYAEEARKEAKRQIEIAEVEFENAKRIRKQAQDELGKAEALRKQAVKKISNTVMEITCQACKQQFQSSTSGVPSEETSIVMGYMSSATTEGEAE